MFRLVFILSSCGLNLNVLTFIHTKSQEWPDFQVGCGVPFILARSLRNETKNTGGPLCVCTPHLQSKDPPLRKGRGLCTMGASTCTLERITLSALKVDKTMLIILDGVHRSFFIQIP